MATEVSQRAYWDRAAATKTFTHPLDAGWMAAHVARQAAIVDYGCGQGRLCGELRLLGYTNVSGVDFAPAMIEQARRAHPGMRFEVVASDGPALAAGPVDCILLFAVLTCVPDDAAQQALVARLQALLGPGGLLYLSDYPIQRDARNAARYEKHAVAGEPFGVFATEDDARVRHHTPQWLESLFGGFRKVEAREIDIVTMNGHRSTALQWLLRKRA